MPRRRTDLPSYRDLLDRTDGPPGSTWGVFGTGDQLGTINLLTEATALRAAGLITTGHIINLDYPLNSFVPGLYGVRPATVHNIYARNPTHRDDWLDSFYLQSTTQIDGLRHMADPQYGFYGGVPADNIGVAKPDLGIQLVAEKGIFGRGVLLDLPLYFASIGRDYDRSASEVITPADLDGALAFHGLRWESGDILTLRTGWSAFYLALSTEEQAEFRTHLSSPGLDQSVEILEYLWDNQISAVFSDNAAVEVLPTTSHSAFFDPAEPTPEGGVSHNGMMHRPIIARLGLTLGECFNLDALAEACAADSRYEFALSAKPLDLIGGVGSPANAMAIK